MFPFAALIPLVAQFVPDLVGQMFGPKAGETVQAVSKIVENVTGVTLTTDDDVSRAMEVISAAPNAVTALRAGLTEINLRVLEEMNAAEERKRQAIIETLRLELADVQSARGMAIEVSKVGGVAGMVPTILALGMVGTLCAVIIILLMGRWDPAVVNSPVVVTMLSMLASGVTAVLAFYFGSTVGSRSKDSTIAQAQRDLAGSVPSGSFATR